MAMQAAPLLELKFPMSARGNARRDPPRRDMHLACDLLAEIASRMRSPCRARISLVILPPSTHHPCNLLAEHASSVSVRTPSTHLSPNL
eukprot:3742344-Pleurochrysis_carterae.AAC.1